MKFERHSLLGEIEMKETLLYYDGPKLFTAKSATGQWLLVFCVEEVDEDELSYLGILISKKRLKQVLAGKVSLRDAIVERESEGVLYYVGNNEGADFEDEYYEIPDTHLPSEGAFLDPRLAEQQSYR